MKVHYHDGHLALCFMQLWAPFAMVEAKIQAKMIKVDENLQLGQVRAPLIYGFADAHE